MRILKNKLRIVTVITILLVLAISLTSCNKDGTIKDEETITTKEEKSVVNMQPTTSKECGDGVCSRKETYQTCPQECAVTCGDGIVQEGENWKNCRYDLLYTCGNGVCEEWEHYQYCSEDCEACIIDQYNQYEGANECPPNPRWVN